MTERDTLEAGTLEAEVAAPDSETTPASPTYERRAARAHAMPAVLTPLGARPRRIAEHDLSSYRSPDIEGNRSALWRAAWYLTCAILFQSALPALLPSRFKAAILRAFGAKVGRGVVIKPRVTIKYPWFLEIGDHVWIGEMAWIDNHCPVRIGSHSCISQAAYLLTGNHDWNDRGFGFFCEPIEIGESAWIGAFARLMPGTIIPPGTVVLAGWRAGTEPAAPAIPRNR